MNQMSSSLDSHWSNRRNGPRDNKRTPEEQEKELYDKSPYPTHPIYLVYGKHQGFSKASSPVSAESIDSPGTSLPQLGTFKEGALRSAAQMVSYEVSIGLILIVRLVSAFGSAKAIARMFP
ncbi:hypothetical protein VNO77_49288 [Canavalia gladiata]|uniref:Uncharacterized protein n=1 Tax=Canavalia gladiata TaxID=3824 RepID=A0AAN9JDB3_CANGL